MKTIAMNEIRFKDGTSWPVGEIVIVEVDRTNPRLAIIENYDGETRKVQSVNLHKWFDDFISFGDDDIEAAICDGICPSLTGDQVEPDGWDSEGFPSILLAAGLI